MATVEEVLEHVRTQRTVVQSAVALIADLRKKVEDAQDDPQQLQQVIDELRTNQTQLAEALATNTGAAAEVGAVPPTAPPIGTEPPPSPTGDIPSDQR